MAKSSGVFDKAKKRKQPSVVVHHPERNPDASADHEPSSSKRQKISRPEEGEEEDGELDTTRPSAVYKPAGGRDWTLSIALPGSFIANTKNFDQKTDLAARIARAAAVFCVDEIVIFDDEPETVPPNLQWAAKGKGKNAKKKTKKEVLQEVTEDNEAWDNPDQFLYHVLSYLECPGHLRQALFPQHANLKGAGKMPTLDMPHHMKKEEWMQYREGVALDPQQYAGGKRGASGDSSSLVECGLSYPVRLDMKIPPGQRVTIKFNTADPPPSWPHLSEKQIAALEPQPVAASLPREEAGYYWGYQPRLVDSLSNVLVECPFEGGYDYVIGTSERGVPLSQVLPDATKPGKSSRRTSSSASAGGPNKVPSQFKHLLLVFGGVTGLEPAVANDPEFRSKGLTKETAHTVFDAWVNLVPNQGSRTIRLEEAVWLGLMGFRGYVESQNSE
ncbi:DUF171-domain-containing protein [Aaosphaeria arxii CBS 175.79]|uniref:DUF171-domain-containing protein n=1 Tax=Aaosphaeria arxii CBS 175.79 TaxID=1450172 RepID=A0A6A5Y8B7_9PLEO|nr:DUF171-domain-containing protein [Aaosphaeria arxii CBS 175.79]KAF2021805.1 DUF171-domain-containing protein [Aaosphaeria arxii CBS 175.79]